jgi:hypothetical protein
MSKKQGGSEFLLDGKFLVPTATNLGKYLLFVGIKRGSCEAGAVGLCAKQLLWYHFYFASHVNPWNRGVYRLPYLWLLPVSLAVLMRFLRCAWGALHEAFGLWFLWKKTWVLFYLRYFPFGLAFSRILWRRNKRVKAWRWWGVFVCDFTFYPILRSNITKML